jgi:hypothetical protein
MQVRLFLALFMGLVSEVIRLSRASLANAGMKEVTKELVRDYLKSLIIIYLKSIIAHVVCSV